MCFTGACLYPIHLALVVIDRIDHRPTRGDFNWIIYVYIYIRVLYRCIISARNNITGYPPIQYYRLWQNVGERVWIPRYKVSNHIYTVARATGLPYGTAIYLFIDDIECHRVLLYNVFCIILCVIIVCRFVLTFLRKSVDAATAADVSRSY